MAENIPQTPVIFDIEAPGAIEDLKYGEILTDPSSAVRHRLLVANEIAEQIVGLNVPAQYGFATLRTAIAAATGRLPDKKTYALPAGDTFANYSNPEKRMDRWKTALRCAEGLSYAAGQPFYGSGGYQDIGLVLPMQGIAPGTVVAEVRKAFVNHEPCFETSLVFMGLRRRLVQEGCALTFRVVTQNRRIEMRSTGGLGDGSSTAHTEYDFGVEAIDVVLGTYVDSQVEQRAARAFLQEVGGAISVMTFDNPTNYGTPVLRRQHVALLQSIRDKHYADGVPLLSTSACRSGPLHFSST